MSAELLMVSRLGMLIQGVVSKEDLGNQSEPVLSSATSNIKIPSIIFSRLTTLVEAALRTLRRIETSNSPSPWFWVL